MQDDPRRRPTDAEPDWVDELQNAVRWQKILESADNDLKVCRNLFLITSLLFPSSFSTISFPFPFSFYNSLFQNTSNQAKSIRASQTIPSQHQLGNMLQTTKAQDTKTNPFIPAHRIPLHSPHLPLPNFHRLSILLRSLSQQRLHLSPLPTHLPKPQRLHVPLLAIRTSGHRTPTPRRRRPKPPTQRKTALPIRHPLIQRGPQGPIRAPVCAGESV